VFLKGLVDRQLVEPIMVVSGLALVRLAASVRGRFWSVDRVSVERETRVTADLGCRDID
jgi:hypothetical protein